MQMMPHEALNVTFRALIEKNYRNTFIPFHLIAHNIQHQAQSENLIKGFYYIAIWFNPHTSHFSNFLHFPGKV